MDKVGYAKWHKSAKIMKYKLISIMGKKKRRERGGRERGRKRRKRKQSKEKVKGWGIKSKYQLVHMHGRKTGRPYIKMLSAAFYVATISDNFYLLSFLGEVQVFYKIKNFFPSILVGFLSLMFQVFS